MGLPNVLWRTSDIRKVSVLVRFSSGGLVVSVVVLVGEVSVEVGSVDGCSSGVALGGSGFTGEASTGIGCSGGVSCVAGVGSPLFSEACGIWASVWLSGAFCSITC